MGLPHRIYVRPSSKTDCRSKATERGPLYEATYNGELICISHQPFFDGARVLRGRGLSGALEMWDRERPWPRMRSTIENAAQLTVVEGRSTDIRIDKWKPADDGLRGLNAQRRKHTSEALGSSKSETSPDGVTAKVEV